MARAFSEREMTIIREKLKESADQYARTIGMKKTSLDQLAADAEISKSVFYRFYESKEHLFLEVIIDWHKELVKEAIDIIRGNPNIPIKERLVQCIMHTVVFIDEHEMIRVLFEDAPALNRRIPDADERINHAQIAFEPILRSAQVEVTIDYELLSQTLHALFWTLANKNEIGGRYLEVIELMARATLDHIIKNA